MKINTLISIFIFSCTTVLYANTKLAIVPAQNNIDEEEITFEQIQKAYSKPNTTFQQSQKELAQDELKEEKEKNATIDEKKVKLLQKEFIEKVIVANKYKSRFKNYLSKICGDIYLNDTCVEKKIAYIKTWDTVKKDKVLINALDERVERLSLDKEKFEQDVLKIDEKYWEKVKHKLNDKLKHKELDHTQFVSLIDLSRQKIIIALYESVQNDYYPIGVDLISSGNMNREADIKYGEDHYFNSPKGIFKIKGGWRSDGEENENGSLGYGAKDRYIFYLGRQKAVRYNTFDKEGNKIEDKNKWKLIKDELEYAIHAHESDMPLGGAYSHGCIRTSNELNRFLDSNLVLHKNNLNLEDYSWKQRYVPSPKDPKNHTLAGEYVIIVDKI